MKTTSIASESLMLHKGKEVAVAAVRESMKLAVRIQNEFSSHDFLTKSDRSPVTIADFAIQALVANAISSVFPDIPLIGEEDSLFLRKDVHSPLLDKIHYFLKQSHEHMNRSDILYWIDRGTGPIQDLFWTLDPIDGTKGFLRNDQFAIALALIERGKVLLGVLGCPRLRVLGKEESDEGFLFSAVKGEGALMHNLSRSSCRSIRVSRICDPTLIKIVESYESSHSDTRAREEIQKMLRISTLPIQLDGQVKYGLVAAGAAEIYLRIPHPADIHYQEKIWDHAAGALMVEEAGGRVSDINGLRLDFSCGKSLNHNHGIFASNGLLHEDVLSAISTFIVRQKHEN